MSNVDREAMMDKINDYVEKANYLAVKIIDNYGLDEGEVGDQLEALRFANNRKDIGMDMEILCDYISNIQRSLCIIV